MSAYFGVQRGKIQANRTELSEEIGLEVVLEGYVRPRQ